MVKIISVCFRDTLGAFHSRLLFRREQNNFNTVVSLESICVPLSLPECELMQILLKLFSFVQDCLSDSLYKLKKKLQ